MGSRLELQNELENILGNDHVYFQPPAKLQMQYPSIVYERSDFKNTFANNSVYGQAYGYRITVIDTRPDSETVKIISKMPMCRWIRRFTSENLTHNIFTLYY